MDSKVFRSFKFFFASFAFEPLKVELRFNYSWLWFHSALALVELIVITKYWNSIVYVLDPIGKFVDEIRLFSMFVSYLAAILVSWYHKNMHKEISRQVNRLESTTEKFYVSLEDHQKILHNSYKRKFLFLLSFQLFLIAEELYVKYGEVRTLRLILSLSVPSIFCTLKHLHGMFYIDMANNFASILNCQLLNVKNLMKINETKLKNETYWQFLFGRLKLCKSFHKTLTQLYELVNQWMGAFFFVNQINLHINILTHVYWITFRVFNEKFNLLLCKNSVAA